MHSLNSGTKPYAPAPQYKPGQLSYVGEAKARGQYSITGGPTHNGLGYDDMRFAPIPQAMYYGPQQYQRGQYAR